jgi:hypothetical protein
MSVINETQSLHHFQTSGALRSKRYRNDLDRNVYAVYFRNVPVCDIDVQPIQALSAVVDTLVFDRTLIGALTPTYLKDFEVLELLELSNFRVSLRRTPDLSPIV